MEALLQRLALFARAEALAMRLRARHAMRATVLSSLAIVAALFAFGMINLLAFNLIDAPYGHTAASVSLAAGDALIAALLLHQARRRRPTTEEALVDEMRALLLAELRADAKRLEAQLLHVQQEVTRIGKDISRVTQTGPLQVGLSSVGPILELASRFLRRRKDA